MSQDWDWIAEIEEVIKNDRYHLQKLTIEDKTINLEKLLTGFLKMKEALEEVSVVYYEASSKITEDHLKGHIMFGTNPEKQKIIDDHNRRAWVGIKTLARLASGDFHE